MKLFATIFFLLSSSAFANCEFSSLVHEGRGQEIARETDFFGHEERLMIMTTLKLEKWRVVKNEHTAVWDFQDRYYDERGPGPDAGVVIWYSLENKTFAHVQFTRNGFEYGAVFEQLGKTYKLSAQIERGQLKCI